AMRTELESRPVVLPQGWALAEPGRRLLATVFDGVLAAAICAKGFGTSTWAVLSLRVLLEPGGSWMALPLMLVGAAVVGGVCEWLFGATPGKFVMGIRVLACDPKDASRAREGQAPGLPVGRAL